MERELSYRDDEIFYTTNNGMQATLQELTEMLDSYTIDQLNEFYYGLFDKLTKTALKPYFVSRMKAHGGI